MKTLWWMVIGKAAFFATMIAGHAVAAMLFGLGLVGALPIDWAMEASFRAYCVMMGVVLVGFPVWLIGYFAVSFMEGNDV